MKENKKHFEPSQGYPNVDICKLGTKHRNVNFWRFLMVTLKALEIDAHLREINEVLVLTLKVNKMLLLDTSFQFL